MAGREKKGENITHIDFRNSIILFGVSMFLFAVAGIPGDRGNVWRFIHEAIWGTFGVLGWLLPCEILYFAFSKFIENKTGTKIGPFKVSIILMILCMIIDVFFSVSLSQKDFLLGLQMSYRNGIRGTGGGIIGFLCGSPFVYMFGVLGTKIIFLIVILTILLILTIKNPEEFFDTLAKPFLSMGNFITNAFRNFFDRKNLINIIKGKKNDKKKESTLMQNRECREDNVENEEKCEHEENIESPDQPTNSELTSQGMSSNYYQNPIDNESESEFFEEDNGITNTNYSFPSISFLNKSENLVNSDDAVEMEEKKRALINSLKSFNIEAKITATSRGPTITRFELQPSAGVKISKITNLSDDIALSLAAFGIRFEAPIPGKSAIGVEIPNKVLSIVNMRELIASSTFKCSQSKLTVVLGRDISGKIVIADLAKMPHLLIAGSTGSGKSVCINSFIISLLYKARPEDVKFLMIDPKVVELGIYNGIPHLLAPVVTDPRKAAKALKWAVDKMLQRYKIFAKNSVRDINSYNQFVSKNKGINPETGEVLQRLEKIVIIIDELSDLMMAAPKDVESYICRLAQMARAAGIHLVIATQRPSVDVITGIIKANIPSRIALAVSSQVDSRTILDMCGAEKLIGRGDMLFSPIGSSKPIRIQGCFVTDEEVENVVQFVKKNYEIEKEIKLKT